MRLYRGEAIKYGRPERIQVFQKVLRAGFPVEFINGGNPYLLAKLGFFDAAAGHVAKDFNFQGVRHRKHFVSFSEDRNVALGYSHGGGAPADYREEVTDRLYYSDITSGLIGGSYKVDEITEADHMIVSLDVSGGEPLDKRFDIGVIKTYNGGQSKILALKAYEYFELQKDRMGKYVTQDVITSAEYSKKDKEWLILVLDLIPSQPQVPPSSSGIITHGDPLTIELCIDPANQSYGNSASFL